MFFSQLWSPVDMKRYIIIMNLSKVLSIKELPVSGYLVVGLKYHKNKIPEIKSVWYYITQKWVIYENRFPWVRDKYDIEDINNRMYTSVKHHLSITHWIPGQYGCPPHQPQLNFTVLVCVKTHIMWLTQTNCDSDIAHRKL